MKSDQLHVGIDAFRLVGPPTSIGTYTEELIDSLVKLGYRITLYAPRDEPGSMLDQFRRDSGPCEVRCAENPLYPETSPRDLFVWNQWVLPRMVRRRRCDAFIAPYHQTPCFLPSATPAISVIHDLCGLRRDCGYRFGGRAFVRHLWNLLSAALFATRIIPISEMTRRDMLQKFPFCRDRIAKPVYNRVTGSTLEPEDAAKHLLPYAIPRTGFVLVFALLSPRKGLDLAIRGYIQYRKAGGLAPLVMIGVKDEKSMKARFPDFMHDDIIMLPRVSTCERDALYRLASCLLFCSRCEGFGYPVVEAMRQGCPVVASKNTPAHEISEGLLELMEDSEVGSCAALITRYTGLRESQRQELAVKLIKRSLEFSGGNFGKAFDVEIKKAIGLERW